MKILFVDTTLDGHHLQYLKSLTQSKEHEYIVAVGECCYLPKVKNYQLSHSTLSLIPYIRWLCTLRKIVKIEKPDIIHILNGDALYRFLGLLLKMVFSKTPTIITFHHLRKDMLHVIALKRIMKIVDFGVVHTNEIKRFIEKNSIRNIVHIEYPQFNTFTDISKSECCEILDIPSDVPVLLSLGGTRYDKGLDLLLSALNKVECNFILLIAGVEVDFNRDYIEKMVNQYSSKVKLLLKYLSDKEMSVCLGASDVIVLPYREIFDGASGPLGEGVAMKKIIVGPSHGSLNDIIINNHLGYTFQTENIKDLGYVIEKALAEKFEYDLTALEYRSQLSTEVFREKYQILYTSIQTKNQHFS